MLISVISGSESRGSITVPVNVARPVVSGINLLGQTVSVSSGTWVNNPTLFSYQVQRNGVNIPGETNNTYVLQSTDLSQQIGWKVTASNVIGYSATYSDYAVMLPAQADNLVDRDGNLLQTRTSVQLITR